MTQPFRIRAIRSQFVAPPDFRSLVSGAGIRTVGAATRWLRIETDFDSVPEWADDVQLKYYVLLRGRPEANGPAQPRLFVGEATYVNVARGIRHTAAMFLRPSIIQRYSNGNLEFIAVQLFYKGQLTDQASAPATRERWWERYTPMPGYLLTPQQTPWSIVAYDRYEESKPATP